jgi:hypothetical protein
MPNRTSPARNVRQFLRAVAGAVAAFAWGATAVALLAASRLAPLLASLDASKTAAKGSAVMQPCC